jgi:hypothetical protein
MGKHFTLAKVHKPEPYAERRRAMGVGNPKDVEFLPHERGLELVHSIGYEEEEAKLSATNHTMPGFQEIALPPAVLGGVDFPCAGFWIRKEPKGEGVKKEECRKWVFQRCYDRDPKEAHWWKEPYCGGKLGKTDCHNCWDRIVCKRWMFYELHNKGVVPGESARSFAERMGCCRYDICDMHFQAVKNSDRILETGKWCKCPWALAAKSHTRTGAKKKIEKPKKEVKEVEEKKLKQERELSQVKFRPKAEREASAAWDRAMQAQVEREAKAAMEAKAKAIIKKREARIAALEAEEKEGE